MRETQTGSARDTANMQPQERKKSFLEHKFPSKCRKNPCVREGVYNFFKVQLLDVNRDRVSCVAFVFFTFGFDSQQFANVTFIRRLQDADQLLGPRQEDPEIRARRFLSARRERRTGPHGRKRV